MSDLERRRFLQLLAGAGVIVTTPGCSLRKRPDAEVSSFGQPGSETLNDIHSQLNETRIHSVHRPSGRQEINDLMNWAKNSNLKISCSGGRHAMGTQQFGEDCLHIDTRNLARLYDVNQQRGVVEIDSGIQWDRLVSGVIESQSPGRTQWGIRQKQTGADRLTIGGSLSANGHGRGLAMKPLVDDVESINIITADGREKFCSRDDNSELFSLAIGGYGLFGIITKVWLRLMPRQRLERKVEIIDAETIADRFYERTQQGYLFGDCQFSIDDESPDFLKKSVFSCYRPVADSTEEKVQKKLNPEDWIKLINLARNRKQDAFKAYAAYYLATDGQKYWSDTHQASVYIDDYSEKLPNGMDSSVPKTTEMISELYVPHENHPAFMEKAKQVIRGNGAKVLYGTIRHINQDTDTYLAWAKQDYLCTIFNLTTPHTAKGIARSKKTFQELIDLALSMNGSYFLTYHRWARKDQVQRAYPMFADFLKLKLKYDPGELFVSQWYRHYRTMFSEDV